MVSGVPQVGEKAYLRLLDLQTYIQVLGIIRVSGQIPTLIPSYCSNFCDGGCGHFVINAHFLTRSL